MRRDVVCVALLIVGAALPSRTVQAGIVDFDSIPASCCYADVTPGGARGPLLVFPGVTFDGGVVMDNTGWFDRETTAPNLYGTSDRFPLHDGSMLPGSITAVFTTPLSLVSLDVINGLSAATFTLSAYGAGSVFLGSRAISLATFTSPGDVGSLSLGGIGPIHSILLTSNQGAGNIDFAIDTVTFDPVPEPGTLLLVGAGLTGLALRRRRRV